MDCKTLVVYSAPAWEAERVMPEVLPSHLFLHLVSEVLNDEGFPEFILLISRSSTWQTKREGIQ